MQNKNYENQILDAIQMVVNNSVSKAHYDKTIQGIISRCIDATIGKYVVKYQDSSFYAYSYDINKSYPVGTAVYVLVPGNDMSKEKSIIGTVENLGADYISIVEGENGYEVTGTNCINNNDTIYSLNSYKSNEVKILYDKDNNINLISIDEESLKKYIQKSDSIICGANFKTALPEEQRFKGDYGIIFEINFKDNVDGTINTKTYVVNIDQMVGNPYLLSIFTRQYSIFKVDGINFDSIKRISIFEHHFPNTKENAKDDIFIQKIELSAANALSAEEKATQTLTFITPQGVYFDDTNINTNEKLIQAQVRIKGKIANDQSQKIKYYWFREDATINQNSEKYNQYGGIGWQCLNNYNIISSGDTTHPAIVEWVPNKNTIITTKEDNVAKETLYKCVAIYGNQQVVSKTLVIYNYSSDYNISITSNKGVHFYYDLGTPTLTCKINDIIPTDNKYKYVWSVIDNNNHLTILEETTDKNTAYNNAVSAYNQLIEDIENENAFEGASQEDLILYNNIIKSYDNVMRVEKEKIINLNISTITNFSTYKCAVYYNNIYIGSSSIVITNSFEDKNDYSLIINNGNQVFKYNEDGIAPNCKALDNSQLIYPLSFTLINSMGEKINLNAIKNQDIAWTIPTNMSMIQISTEYGNPIKETKDTATYVGYPELHFNIRSLFDIKRDNNEIELSIKYKDKIFSAKTKMLFLKEGLQGTNGTNFICKIVPNIVDDNFDQNIIYTKIDNQEGSLNYTPRQSGKWFKAQLWKNGELIFDNIQSGNSTEGSTVNIKWSILQNLYYDNTHDISAFQYNETNNTFSYNEVSTNDYANIVKCELTYLNKTYYAMIPIILVKMHQDNTSMVLRKNTGFKEVLYSASGVNPQWDNVQPFTIDVYEQINGIKENISLLEISEYAVDFNWYVYGGSYVNDVFEPCLKIDNYRTLHLSRNQKYYKPNDTFDGYSVNNGVLCKITRNNIPYGEIYIPIHLYLNRFGNEAMNGWDGNTIQINNDDGVILSPQVGAGKKNEDNSFTGVFMGSVKEAGTKDIETGLFGYNNGERTINLNAENGSAKFGKNGSGQIIIDPSSNKAVLQSGNYDEAAGTGMKIDLSEPSIKFGSGKFGVNSNGEMFATGFATTEYVDGQKADTDAAIGDLQDSIKTFDVKLSLENLLIPAKSDQKPIETKTYEITYKGLFKGKTVTGVTAQINSTAVGINTSIDSTTQTISFLINNSTIVENLTNNFLFTFQYKDTKTNTLYTATKTIAITLAIQGVDGAPGPKGEDGTGVNILGSYDTVEDLIEAHPTGSPGDAYLINENLYVWSETLNTWTNSGSIQGPAGKDGQDGAAGKNGENGKSAYQIWLDQGNVGTIDDYLESLKGQNGKDGDSSINALLTNESHVLAAKSNGTIISYEGAETDIKVYDGSTDVTSQCHFSKNESGVSGTLTNNHYTITSVTNGIGGNVIFTIAYKTVTLTKTLSVSVSKQGTKGDTGLTGDNGNDGNGIVSIVNTYKTTTTQIQPNASDFLDTQITPPALDKTNKFLWRKEVITYSNTGVAEPIITLLAVYGDKGDTGQQGEQGDPGQKGANGKGIVKIDQYYLLTTEKTRPSASDFPSTPSTTPPLLDATNKYLWQKEKILYTDNTTSNDIISLIAVYGDKGAQGDPGTNAQLVKVTASGQIFKSESGIEGPFNPGNIYLYPNFQEVNYNKWQYSVDGAVWNNITSGAHGLTIGTYNSVAHSLKVDSTSDLFTEDVTAITFKCLSNVNKIEDSVTILKIYDNLDLNIGGRNYLLDSQKHALDQSENNKIIEYELSTPMEIGETYTLSLEYIIPENVTNITGYVSKKHKQLLNITPENTRNKQRSFITFVADYAENESPLNDLTNANLSLYRLPEGTGTFEEDIEIFWAKLEKGNIKTDWTAAPEDLIIDTHLEYTYTETEKTPSASSTWTKELPKNIPLTSYIWQRVVSIINNEPTYSSVICISKPAHYIVKKYFEYAQSESGNVAPTDGWSPIKPDWTENKYLWVRTVTQWADETEIQISDVYCDTDSMSLQNMINNEAMEIKNGLTDGYVRILHNTIYLMNATTVEDSTEVIRMNNHGIAFAKVPNPGDFQVDAATGEINDNDPAHPVFTSVWALDGTFDAQSIKVMNLTADTIKNGILRLYDTPDSAYDGKVLIFKGNPPAGDPNPEDDSTAVVTVSSQGINVKSADGGILNIGTEGVNNGIQIINPGGQTIFNITKEGHLVEMTKSKITQQLDLGDSLRGIIMEKEVNNKNHRGIGFIKI